MTQEERDIIYKDACCRLPYHPYAAYTLEDGTTVQAQLTGADEMAEYYGYISDTWGRIPSFDIKLYLRPMSSMTDEEEEEYSNTLYVTDYGNFVTSEPTIKTFDWLNSHHFDYRGLISMGLALEAPKDMYEL